MWKARIKRSEFEKGSSASDPVAGVWNTLRKQPRRAPNQGSIS